MTNQLQLNIYRIKEALHLYENNKFGDKQPFTVMCEDGVAVVTDLRHFGLSALFFSLNYKYNLPIISSNLIESTLRGRSLSTGTFPEHLSVYAKYICEVGGYSGSATMDELSKDLIQVNNHVYNTMVIRAQNSRVSISILDFLQVINHPFMKKLHEEMVNGDINIKHAYKETEKFLKYTKDLQQNKVIKAVKTGMANTNQVMQCVMTLGYPTEVNGDIMPFPITTNFTRGIRDVYSYVTESFSASKSYYFTDEPLKKSEYFSRRLQLVTMTVQRLHHNVDCGSTTYLKWPEIKPPAFDEDGNMSYAGDLNFMTGKYYVNEETNKLEIIKGNEAHLHNKPLLIRTAIGCNHPDKAGVCEVCYGELARNIPAISNLGHTNTCVMTQQTTQGTMGNKHLNASAVAVAIIMSEMASTYFVRPNNHSFLKIKPFFKDKGMTLTLEKENVRGITDLVYIENISKINHSRVTAVVNVAISHTENGKIIDNVVRVAQMSRRAYLSKAFLQYIKEYGYTLDAKGNFVFNLDNWSFNQPVFEFTRKEQNLAQHSQEIAVLIESSMEEITNRENPDSPQQTLYELFNKVNQKLNVHLSCLEVIIYAFMIPEKGNFGLARGSKAPILGIYNQIISGRSLSAQYIYEDLTKVVMSPQSFKSDNRPSHPVDVFFHPKEVLNQYKNIAPDLRRYKHPHA